MTGGIRGKPPVEAAGRKPLTGISSVGRDLLRTVAAHDGESGITIQKVFEAETDQFIHPSNFYTHLGSLEEAGLIDSRTNPRDGRKRTYSITDLGRQRLAAHRSWFVRPLGGDE